jgi:uncharacterized membrane protein
MIGGYEMSKQRKFTTKDLVVSGMLAAMCAIATYFQIPFGAGAMVHLGTACIFIIGIMFGGVYAGLAAAFGSAFFDLFFGHPLYILWSFVIKGIAGFIVGSIAKGMWPEATVNTSKTSGQKIFWRAALGCILAAAWTLGGYTVAWWQVTGSFTTAVTNMPSSLMTSSAGMIIALLTAPKLRILLHRQ